MGAFGWYTTLIKRYDVVRGRHKQCLCGRGRGVKRCNEVAPSKGEVAHSSWVFSSLFLSFFLSLCEGIAKGNPFYNGARTSNTSCIHFFLVDHTDIPSNSLGQDELFRRAKQLPLAVTPLSQTTRASGPRPVP